MDVGTCTYPECTAVNATYTSLDGFWPAYLVLADWEGMLYVGLWNNQGLREVCAGLSHFLNYCWGVLDEAQAGFGDVITQIWIVSYPVRAACGWSKDGAFD